MVGRSPFAIPGGDNASDALTERVLSLPAPSTDLDDVPIGLDRLLRRGLAKHPAERPKTMLDFARGLQAVEKAAGYPPTQLVLAADDATSLVRAQMTQSAPPGEEGSRALPDAAPATAAPTERAALPGHRRDANPSPAAAASDFSYAELSRETAPAPASALLEPPSDTVRRGPAQTPESDQVERSPGPFSPPEAADGLGGGEAERDEDGLSAAAPDTDFPPNSPVRLKLPSPPAVSPDTVVHQPRSIGFGASPGEPPYPAQQGGAPTGDHASPKTVLRPAPELAETRLVAPNRQPSWQELDDRANQPEGPGNARFAAAPVSPASPPPAGGSVPPEPSSDRQRPRTGRRGKLLGVSAVLVGLALVMGFLVLPRADQQSAAPSTGGTPPSPSPKADMTQASLLRAGDLTAGVGGTWRAANWPVVVCLPDISGVSTSSDSASFTASWLHGMAAHRIELFETKEAAARGFSAARAALGGCSTPDMLYLANGWAISSLGQQAVGVSYIVQGKTSVYHTVLLIRSGRMLNWLDLGRQKTAITGQQALVVARNLLRHQSGDSAAGPAPGLNSRIGMSQPPASNSPGQILSADFPQIPGSKSAWSMYTTSAVDNDGARVLCDDIAVSKTKGARMRLAQGWATSGTIWIDVYALDFSKADAARGLYRRLQSNLSTCKGSNLFVTPFRGLGVSTDRGLARGGWIKGQFTDRQVRFAQATFLVDRRVVFIEGQIDPTVATSSAQIDAIVERLVKRSGEIRW